MAALVGPARWNQAGGRERDEDPAYRRYSFVGSHLLSALSEYETFSLERYMTTRYAHGFSRHVKTVFADLRDAHAVRGILREIKPDVAAISPVSYSYDHPQETIEASLMATVNLAEACLRDVPHFERFRFASTSELWKRSSSKDRGDAATSDQSVCRWKTDR